VWYFVCVAHRRYWRFVAYFYLYTQPVVLWCNQFLNRPAFLFHSILYPSITTSISRIILSLFQMLPDCCVIDDVYKPLPADSDSTLTKRRSFGDQYMLFSRQDTNDYMESNFPSGREPIRDMIVVQVGWFVRSFHGRVSTMTAIKTVGHRFRSTPTNGPRFTAPGLPWRSQWSSYGRPRVVLGPWVHWRQLVF